MTTKIPKNAFKPIRLFARIADHAIPQEKGISPLHQAAFQGSIERVQELISSGADVNAKDEFDWTPLHDAAIQGHTQIVKLLIAAGANVNAQDNEEQYTPLHEAARMNYPEIKKMLIDAGADTTLKDKWDNRAEEIEKTIKH